jgi:site-specific DNA-methyltransferase (adenine-specific)
MMGLMPERCIDHVVTDPPYSKHVHSKSRAGARATPLRDGNGEISRSAISRTKTFGFDHLTADTRRACARGFAHVAKRWVMAFSDIESCVWWRLSLVGSGLDFVRTMVWVKEGCTPQFTGDRPAAGAEVITLAHPTGKKVWNAGGKRGIYTVPIELDRYGHGNVLRVHPTQKPLELMLQLVADFTDEGDIVFDPFCGSGTTGVACLRLNRRFVGCDNGTDEKSQRPWSSIAAERLQAEAEGTTVQAKREGQVPLFSGGR